MSEKAIVIVMDGVGAGELPDAASYGDEGANTLGNLARHEGGLALPNFQRLGLGNIIQIEGVPPSDSPEAFCGKMTELSAGKDSTSGHWELAGRVRSIPPAYYHDGFPPEIVRAFAAKTGREMIGNKPASGTAILEELGAEHLRTGRPIVYTSADSVFQIAAHTDVMPVDELYGICRIVREEIMNGNPYGIDRVIARPFEGVPGAFARIRARKDFSVAPPYPTLLDLAREAGIAVVGVGKVDDLFGGRGFTECTHTKSNTEGLALIKRLLLENRANDNKMIIFANLIDFDQEYGHRRDTAGFRKALEEADAALPEIIGLVSRDDFLAITADHGCDPTFGRSTDHTREYAPLLAVCGAAGKPRPLGTRKSFADLGATVAEFMGFPNALDGDSFYEEMKR